MSDAQLILGWDVGGTKSAAALGSENGQCLVRREWPSEAHRGPNAMIADFLSVARQLQHMHPQVRSVGVSIGGPLDGVQGMVHSPPNLPGWNDIPLKDWLQKELGLPVYVLHDATACALAEYRWGCGEQKPSRLAYLTCGTGLGVGFVFDGRPYTGIAGRNPEVGHLRLRGEGPTAFAKAGSVEAYCSGTGLSLLAAWRFPKRWANHIILGRELAVLARTGDRDALEVIRLSGEATGQVCAGLADTLMLDRIVLGSLSHHLGDLWLPHVHAVFAAEALPFVVEHCVIAGSGQEHLQDLSALAAGCLQ